MSTPAVRERGADSTPAPPPATARRDIPGVAAGSRSPAGPGAAVEPSDARPGSGEAAARGASHADDRDTAFARRLAAARDAELPARQPATAPAASAAGEETAAETTSGAGGPTAPARSKPPPSRAGHRDVLELGELLLVFGAARDPVASPLAARSTTPIPAGDDPTARLGPGSAPTGELSSLAPARADPPAAAGGAAAVAGSPSAPPGAPEVVAPAPEQAPPSRPAATAPSPAAGLESPTPLASFAPPQATGALASSGDRPTRTAAPAATEILSTLATSAGSPPPATDGPPRPARASAKTAAEGNDLVLPEAPPPRLEPPVRVTAPLAALASTLPPLVPEAEGALRPARAEVRVGDGPDGISLLISATRHVVRIEAQTASSSLLGALRDSASELGGALRRHGLDLASLTTTLGDQRTPSQPGRDGGDPAPRGAGPPSRAAASAAETLDRPSPSGVRILA